MGSEYPGFRLRRAFSFRLGSGSGFRKPLGSDFTSLQPQKNHFCATLEFQVLLGWFKNWAWAFFSFGSMQYMQH